MLSSKLTLIPPLIVQQPYPRRLKNQSVERGWQKVHRGVHQYGAPCHEQHRNQEPEESPRCPQASKGNEILRVIEL